MGWLCIAIHHSFRPSSFRVYFGLHFKRRLETVSDIKTDGQTGPLTVENLCDVEQVHIQRFDLTDSIGNGYVNDFIAL